MLTWLGSIFAIFLVDLVLSGDNAVVIGVAASGLPRDQRMTAIIVGGGGAIVLRIVFALAATFLLQLRFIGIIGSIILLFIAIRLLVDRSNERRAEHTELASSAKPSATEEEAQIQAQSSQAQSITPTRKERRPKRLLVSIITILLADVTMSLDNVLAVGGLAAGNIVPLIIGLIFSVIFLLVGSALVAEFISRLPWLLDVACLIVAWTAAQIFLGDDSLNAFFEQFTWTSSVVPALAILLVLVTDVMLWIGDRRHAIRSE